MTIEPKFEAYEAPYSYSDEEMKRQAVAFRDALRRRRTVRDYASTDIPLRAVEACIEAAATAPSGANRQPWHFVVVTDPETKSAIREAAEKEEKAFYEERAPDEWLEALKPLGTNCDKPFLERAPVLIAIFARNYEPAPNGEKHKNYYVQESVGIATGMLIAALHTAGFATLTHTPSPMGFLNKILRRPKHERAYLLLVVGRAAPNARVPAIEKKATDEIITRI